MENSSTGQISYWKDQSKRFIDEQYSEKIKLKASSKQRPLVTLTYAQSLDGMIAGPDKKAIAISSEPSFIMTHYIRNCSDGILVGIGTILNENPRLTTRFSYSSDKLNQPIPVVLDSQLRIPLNSNVLERGRMPIIICLKLNSSESKHKKEQLEALGARVFECPGKTGRIDIECCLCLLFENGLRSLMVEGGSQVISEFVSSITTESPLVDLLIITIAPRFIGGSGTPALRLCSTTNFSDKVELPDLTQPKYQVTYSQFGPDLIIGATIP